MRIRAALGVLLILISGTTYAVAQSGDDLDFKANINVSAKVVQSIEMITVNSMEFGNTQPGQNEIYINPIGSPNAGYMIAVGTPESEFRLNYSSEVELTQTDGDGRLIFRYEISGKDTDNQSTSDLFENENQVMQFNKEGRYHIWLGGRLNIENAAPGNYEGDFTIEIEYI